MVADEHHHRVDPRDLDVLDMLTSLPPSHDTRPLPPSQLRVLDTVAGLRRPPIDPIVLAASLSSGPQVTRHHFHHTFADPASAHLSGHSQQMRVSERRRQEEMVHQPKQHEHPSSSMLLSSDAELERRALMYSKQAPRSLRLQREKDEAKVASVTGASTEPNAKTPLVLPGRDVKAPVKPLPPLEVRCCGRTRVPTPHGEVFCHLYRNNHDSKEHMALVIDPAQNHESIQDKQRKGLLSKPRHLRSRTLDAVWHENETPMERLVRGAYVNRLSEAHQEVSQPSDAIKHTSADESAPAPLVRIHSECYTGETIGSQRCDCGEQLDEALRIISTTMTHTKSGQPVPPRGVVVYMRQEGRGIGLLDKLLAYNLQDMGHDTVSANVLLGHLPDARRYDMSSAILRDLGIEECRLLTNNPEKMQAMESEGIRVTERVPMVPRMWQYAHQHDHMHAHAHHNVHGTHTSRRKLSKRLKDKPQSKLIESLAHPSRPSRPSSVISQAMDASSLGLGGSLDDASSNAVWDDDEDVYDDEDDIENESDESAGSFYSHTQRNTGATLIGGSVTRGTDLERYLRTKIERMGHMLTEPTASSATNPIVPIPPSDQV